MDLRHTLWREMERIVITSRHAGVLGGNFYCPTEILHHQATFREVGVDNMNEPQTPSHALEVHDTVDYNVVS